MKLNLGPEIDRPWTYNFAKEHTGFLYPAATSAQSRERVNRGAHGAICGSMSRRLSGADESILTRAMLQRANQRVGQ